MPLRAWPGVSRVLVTGAAGLLGRYVVRHLAAEGWSGVGLMLTAGAAPEGLDAVVEGNAADPVVARRAVAGVDAIVHLAAIPAPTLGASEVVFGQNTLATFPPSRFAFERWAVQVRGTDGAVFAP